MKTHRAILLLSLVASALFLISCASTPKRPAHTLVWCGLDYSKVRMIGTGDFRQPERIFPTMLTEWNKMFMEEAVVYLRDNMERNVQTEPKAVESNNAKARPSQVLYKDGSDEEMVQTSHITPEDIAALVKGYSLEAKEGVGVVFVVDRLVKRQDELCAYVVFFDVATRKVFGAERRCQGASKGSFRTHWFKPLKNISNQSGRFYRKLKTEGAIQVTPAMAGK